MAFRLLEEPAMTPEERDLLLSLTTAVIRCCEHLEFSETAEDVREAWRGSQPVDQRVMITRFEGDE